MRNIHSLSFVQPSAQPAAPADQPAAEASSSAAAQPATNAPMIELELASGPPQVYASPAEFAQAIRAGTVRRAQRARTVTQDKAGKRIESAWQPAEALAIARTDLRALYRPVWHETLRYAGYGALAGMGLKLLHAVFMVGSVDPGMALIFMMMLGAFALTKHLPAMPFIVGFLSFKYKVVGTLCGVAFGACVVGALFGGPIGMIAGTLIGRRGRAGAVTAPDAQPEGRRPLMLGIVAPALALAALVPLYIWFNMVMMEKLG